MKKKLLLADDSVTIQKVVQITFSHDDYDLTVVDNGDIAYEKARAQRPDLILADVFMPGKNGYELCAAVKSDPTLATVPVLLLTGTFEPFDEAKARSVGADRWIAKPFESQALIACVDELLTRVVPAPVVAPQVATPAPAPVEVALPELSSDLPDDIWGSEFVAEEVVGSDEFPPLDAFAATSQDDLWDVSGFETEPVAAVAGTDDLWGNFDAPPTVDLSPAPAVVGSSDDSWESEDFSSSFAGVDTNISAAFDSVVEEVPLADEVEVLEEIDLLEPAANATADIVLEDSFDAESFSFAEEMVEAEEVAAADVWSEPVPTPSIATPLPLPTPPVVPPYPVAGAGDAVAPAALSDAQLESIVERVADVVISRLAGTLLEKIAWEVVPDLAETMIKEELRKIRESVAAD
ncbi:MAG: response regulator [Desulfuromonadales bacterium]|nr:response regulator [Desulfuromonadales bacterium]